MHGPSLEQLYLDFLATGDEAALAQLLRRSGPTLRRMARRLGADAETADDLVQETIVAAIQGAARFDATRPLLPWLKGILTFRIARLARDAVRSPHRRAGGADDGADSIEALAASTPSVVDGLSDRELHADVRDAIAHLPPQYQAPLQQFLLAGRSPVEIASGLGMQRATVRVHLHRGLRRLRTLLQRWSGLVLALFVGRAAAAGSASGTAGARVVPRWGMLLIAAGLVATFVAWPRNLAELAPREPHRVAPVAAGSAPSDDAPRPLANEPNDAPRTAATSPATLVVTVRDAHGEPVPHVGITLAPTAGVDPILHRRRGVTAPTGTVEWPAPAAGDFRLQLDRGPALTIAADGTSQRHVVTLPPAPTRRGRAVDADSRPLAGASIWLGEAGSPWTGTDVATTAADGSFELAHVPAGAFVAARHPSVAGTTVSQVADDGENELRLQLGAAGSSARVRVLDDRGNTVRDAMVFVGEAMDATPLWLADGAAPLRPPPHEGRTDAAGIVVTHALPPGRHRVVVRAVGMAPHSGWLRTEPPRACEHTVVLTPGGAIAGSVCAANGAALAGAMVVLRAVEPGADVDTTTDAAGRFRFECVPAGLAEIAARAPGHSPNVVTVACTPATAAAVTVTLANARTITGDVRFVAGPAAGELRATWPASHLQPEPGRVALDATGNFVFGDGRAGRPALAVRLAGEPLWRDVDQYTDWSGDHVAVRLPASFAADAHWRGTVRAEDGAPLAGSRLFVHRDATTWAEVGRADADGHFELGPFPAGSYALFAESTIASLPSASFAPMPLHAGATADGTWVAPPAGTLDLELVPEGGANRDVVAGDFAITIVGGEPARRYAMHTQRHVRQALVAGDYFVYAMGSRFQWIEAVPVHITAGEVTTLRVPLQTGHRCTLAMRGVPAASPGTMRTFTLHDAAASTSLRTWLLPADASPRLGAVLAPGRYTIAHRDELGAEWRGEFHVDADGARPAIVVPMAPR
jgi:RNA polymerase sigma factor (sigma-70 family)